MIPTEQRQLPFDHRVEDLVQDLIPDGSVDGLGYGQELFVDLIEVLTKCLQPLNELVDVDIVLSENIAHVPVDLADHHGDGHVVDDVGRHVVIDGNAQFVRHLNGLRVELGEKRVPIGWNH